MATKAWSGTTILRVSDSFVLIVTSSETRALPWDSFEGDGAEAVLFASQEKRGHFIEPTEILIGM